jgi:hypothetical protein
MWNLIRSLRGGRNNCHNDINIGDLEKFYDDKFSAGHISSEIILASKQRVDDKVNMLSDVTYDNLYFYEERLKRYIDKMKLGSAHGIDGIMSEHLKYASNCTPFIHELYVLFTICLKFGIVPDTFTKGLIVPILKKPTSNASIPNNYRPVMISTAFSKLMEMFILEEGDYHDFSDSQFGFVPGRGTNMAISLTHDVISYNVKRGSPIAVCSLDAEGAFDAIPHSIISDKAINVMPDPCWRLLYYRYTKVTSQVKWDNCLSKNISILKGTRQGEFPRHFSLIYFTRT